ncbi:hypothetical protein [Rhodoflexus sp.]
MERKFKYFGLVAFAILLLGLPACEHDKVSPQEGEEVACGLEVTAVQMSCAAYGAFGNIYFFTDRGEYIQPWEMFPTFAPVAIQAGKRYIIGYKKVSRDNRYKDLIRCTLYDEKVEKATPVQLTCLSEVGCATTEATVSDMRPVDGCLEFVLDDGERLLADIAHLGIAVADGERVRFAYTIEDGIIPCGTRIPTIGKVARVKCLEKINF